MSQLHIRFDIYTGQKLPSGCYGERQESTEGKVHFRWLQYTQHLAAMWIHFVGIKNNYDDENNNILQLVCCKA